MRTWWKRGMIAASVALLGSLFAVALGSATPAHSATATSFSITVNGTSAAALDPGNTALLAETGLPGDATGTVTFTDSLSNVICTTTLPATNCTTASTLAPGAYTISANYPGDANYAASTSTNTVGIVVQAPTTTVASASPSTVTSGTPVTYSATVTSTFGTPTGTVNFRTPGKGLCSATLTAGAASCSASTAPIGQTTISATYVGDGTFDHSTGTTTVTVSRATPSLGCVKLSGKVASVIKFALCTPSSTLNRTGFAPGSFLTSGGTLTWHRSFGTTIVSLTSTSPGQGACQRNFVEHDLTGMVTGGTSLYALAGDPVSMRICESSRSGSVHLVTGTTAQL